MTSFTKALNRLYTQLRGLSGKYVDTVNSEAKTSNNMELLSFVL